MITIEMLPANEGDCLWIEVEGEEGPHALVVDAGRKGAYRDLARKIEGRGRAVDLFVLTHVDDDHIFGAVPLMSDGRFGAGTFRDVWYNGYTHLDRDVARKPPADALGPKNGEIFAGLLLDRGHPWNEAFGGATVVVPETGPLPVIPAAGFGLTLLSPTWQELGRMKTFWERTLEDLKDAGFEPGDAEAALEVFAERRDLQPDVLGGLLDVDDLVEAEFESDAKEPNGSSIALLAEAGGRAVLLAGDAHPPVLEASLRRLLAERGQERLALDAFKVSHHGSKGNTSSELLDLVDCRRYLISTNGSRHHHPDAEAIARILHRNHLEEEPTELYFNYRSEENEVWDDEDLQIEWNYLTFYPPKGRLLRLGEAEG